MKIVIIGGGLAGMAGAVALHRAGHQVKVYEQAEELRCGGYGLILWPNATGILGTLGLPIQDLGYRLDRVDIVSELAAPLVKVELDRIGERLGAPNVVVRRSVLVEELSRLLPDGVVCFGRQLERIAEPAAGSADPVRVTFADGSTDEAEVLIGADGHRSEVRLFLHGDNTAGHTGWATWHGTTPLPVPLTSGRRVQTMAGAPGLCVMHPLGDGTLYWAFETPWAPGDLVPPGALGTEDGVGSPTAEGASAVANLRARFAGFASPLPELLDSLTDEDVAVFPHLLHKLPDHWSRGRIAIMGDAVHAVPPRTGMGANQALEDAWMLGRIFGETPDAGPQDAAALLHRYERARRRRVKWLYHYAAATGKQGQSVPGLFSRSKDGVSFTGFQRAQIKLFSTFLHAPAALRRPAPVTRPAAEPAEPVAG